MDTKELVKALHRMGVQAGRLISDNDWRGLDDALHRMEMLTLEWELGPIGIRVSTVPADNAWAVAMLVRVEKWVHGRYETQYHESVQKARNT